MRGPDDSDSQFACSLPFLACSCFLFLLFPRSRKEGGRRRSAVPSYGPVSRTNSERLPSSQKFRTLESSERVKKERGRYQKIHDYFTVLGKRRREEGRVLFLFQVMVTERRRPVTSRSFSPQDCTLAARNNKMDDERREEEIFEKRSDLIDSSKTDKSEPITIKPMTPYL